MEESYGWGDWFSWVEWHVRTNKSTYVEGEVEHYKTWLMVKGYKQKVIDYDEVFALVTRWRQSTYCSP